MKKQSLIPVKYKIGLWIAGTVLGLATIGFRKTVAVGATIVVGNIAYDITQDETIPEERV